MALETRTRWIPISELNLEHDIAGFGPVESFYRKDGIVGVSNIFGAYREYNAGTDIELYEGTFDESGHRVSMSTAEYRASVRAEQAARR
jgi:hypothetical protein